MTENGIQMAVDRLAELLQRSVVINDPGVHMLFSSIHFGDEDPIRIRAILKRDAGTKARGHVLAQGVSTWTTAGVIPANEEIGMKARVCVPIRWRGELLGQLIVMDADGSLTTSELSTISQTAKDVAAEMVAHGQREADSRVQEQTVLDLVGGEATLRRRALTELAAGPASNHFENVTAVEFGVQRLSDNATEPHVEAALRSVLSISHMQDRLAQMHAVTSGTGLLLLGSSAPPGEAAIRVHIQKMIDQLDDLSAGRFTCVAGIGPSVSGLEQVHKTARKAHLAQRAAATVLSTPVAAWAELGPYALLLRIPDQDLNQDSLPDEVQQLLAVDPERDLTKTLRIYLDHACNGPAASEALHIHRTTLYYRLGRIAELTGLDLSDGRTRLSLHIGLTMLDLFPAYRPH